MSILYDFHLHSDFSGDSRTPAREMIRRAQSLGLQGICFTEHLDIGGPPYGADFSLDFPAYFHTMQQIREEFRSQIQIGIGLEFGIQPYLTSTLSELCRTWPFDFVIASQHFVNDLDPYYPVYFEGRSEQECYEEFFRAELETLQAISPEDYDTLGHMDYIVRYGPNRNRDYSYEAYADLIDPILSFLIEHGKCLELNTGGYLKGLGAPNPCIEVFRRYRELGGELITIGSDAHAPHEIAMEFHQAADLLTALGFRYYTVFEQRKGRQILF